MTVRVQFFSRLRNVVGNSEIDLDVPDQATVTGLLETLYLNTPALRDWDKSILVASGVEFVGRDYVVQPNDEISIMPPVQGG
ncbi:MAG TPA: MoaD/ThiS family protein [Chthoniobacterales bacterium]|jgi:molybdopterin synthase sulfur carrier subunit|nr:MoaD/ThiS family protein [Chthoniobacterales bacterium]